MAFLFRNKFCGCVRSLAFCSMDRGFDAEELSAGVSGAGVSGAAELCATSTATVTLPDDPELAV